MAQKIIDRSYVGEVLQHVYTSDLEISISLISRGGYFYIATEDKRVSLQGTTIEEAVTHLAFTLAKEFPTSTFAGWWMDTFQEK